MYIDTYIKYKATVTDTTEEIYNWFVNNCSDFFTEITRDGNVITCKDEDGYNAYVLTIADESPYSKFSIYGESYASGKGAGSYGTVMVSRLLRVNNVIAICVGTTKSNGIVNASTSFSTITEPRLSNSPYLIIQKTQNEESTISERYRFYINLTNSGSQYGAYYLPLRGYSTYTIYTTVKQGRLNSKISDNVIVSATDRTSDKTVFKPITTLSGEVLSNAYYVTEHEFPIPCVFKYEDKYYFTNNVFALYVGTEV